MIQNKILPKSPTLLSWQLPGQSILFGIPVLKWIKEKCIKGLELLFRDKGMVSQLNYIRPPAPFKRGIVPKKWQVAKIIILFSFVIFQDLSVSAQEISNIGKTPLLTLDGGISANSVFNYSDVASNRRDPFSYVLTANLNLSVYGWSIPLSAMYSNKSWSYQQPFNTFNLNPSYKWIRTHIGYTSMSFSNYTLSGHQFLGAGVELTPKGNWKFSAMAGRLQKPVLPDSSGSTAAAYYRFGTGFKTEYTFNNGNLGVSMFYARDKINSLPFIPDTIAKTTPKKNLAVSVDGNFNIIKKVTVNFEFGTSLITNDIRELETGEKQNAHRYHGFKTMVNYNTYIGSFGAGIELVQPGYQTLGAYYMNNDFVNYTFNYAGKAVKDKVTLSVSSGLQMDDLDNNNDQQTKRLVNSLVVGFIPSEIVNLNVMYSNFSNYTNIRSGFENINNTSPVAYMDTLDYTQISQTTGATVSINPKASETFKHSMNFSVNYQQASDQQSDNPIHTGNRFVNGMAGYNTGFLKKNINLSANFNISRNKADSLVTVILGPTFTARKAIFNKKMNVSVSMSINSTSMNGEKQAGVTITRLSTGYTLMKKHSFDLGILYANRNNMVKSTSTNEATVTFSYRYNFNTRKKNETK